jgi:hypothetical protein
MLSLTIFWIPCYLNTVISPVYAMNELDTVEKEQEIGSDKSLHLQSTE